MTLVGVQVILFVDTGQAGGRRLAGKTALETSATYSTQTRGFLHEILVTHAARTSVFGETVLTVGIKMGTLDAFSLLRIGGIHTTASALIPCRTGLALLIEL